MKKTITMACMDRPQYTRAVLNSLKNQNKTLDDYKLYINIDTGNCKEVVDICNNIDFIEKDVKIFELEEPEVNVRVNKNTYDVVRRAFNDGSDFNFYLEDDIVASPDALNLMDWYMEQDLTDIASMNLCNIWEKIYIDSEIVKVRSCCFWGFLVNKYQFEKYFEPIWTKGYCWDSHIARYIRSFEGIYNFIPLLSRTTNIGENGVNPSFRWNKIMNGHKYNEDKKKFEYYVNEA